MTPETISWFGAAALAVLVLAAVGSILFSALLLGMGIRYAIRTIRGY